MKKTNNIISDWLEKYGDPEIEKQVEKEIQRINKTDMTLHINKIIKVASKVNNLKLREDLRRNNIYNAFLFPQGYVGNRPKGFKGVYHEDDTWAIDCFTNDGQEVDSYLYSSEKEYKEDLKTLNIN